MEKKVVDCAVSVVDKFVERLNKHTDVCSMLSSMPPMNEEQMLQVRLIQESRAASQRGCLVHIIKDEEFQKQIFTEFMQIDKANESDITLDEYAEHLLKADNMFSTHMEELERYQAGNPEEYRQEMLQKKKQNCRRMFAFFDIDKNQTISIEEYMVQKACEVQDLSFTVPLDEVLPASAIQANKYAAGDADAYKEFKRELMAKLWIDLYAAREQHNTACEHYRKMYSLFAGPQILIAGAVSVASAIWPEEDYTSEQMRFYGKVVVSTGSALTTALIAFGNLLELQSRKDLHSQAVKMYASLMTDLRWGQEVPSEISTLVGEVGGVATLQRYIASVRSKIVELDASTPRVPTWIVEEVRRKMWEHGHEESSGEEEEEESSGEEEPCVTWSMVLRMLAFAALAATLGVYGLRAGWQMEGKRAAALAAVGLLMLFVFGLAWHCCCPGGKSVRRQKPMRSKKRLLSSQQGCEPMGPGREPPPICQMPMR